MKKIKKYFNEVIRELKKVSWSSRKTTINKTVLVIAVSLFMTAYIGGLDMIFKELIEKLINN